MGEEATEAPVEAETPPKKNNVAVHRVLDRAEDAVLGLFSVGRDASGEGDEGEEKVPQELDRQTKAVNEGMPIVFVTAEVSPWSKPAGWATCAAPCPRRWPPGVTGSSSSPTARAARATRTIHTATTPRLHLNHGDQHVRYFARYKDDVTYLFVAHPALERGGGGRIYGGSPGNL